MHLKILFFVALVALGTAAKQSRKNANYEEIGNKRWKKDLGYTKKSQLNDNNYNSQKNVPYPRKDGRKPKSQLLEPVDQISPYSEQESESIGTSEDMDYISTQIPEDNLNEDSFVETDPHCLIPSGSYPNKQTFDETICNKRVQDWDNEGEWNLIQRKLKGLYNMLTPEARHSVPTKSQIGSSDQAERRAAEEVESPRDSEKLVDEEECAGRSHSKLPSSRKTQITTERYLNSKNGMKLSSDIMTKLYPEQRNVKSLDRQLKVHERSMEISALGAKLAKIEEKLAEISEFLLGREVDELYSNSVDMLVRPVMRE